MRDVYPTLKLDHESPVSSDRGRSRVASLREERRAVAPSFFTVTCRGTCSSSKTRRKKNAVNGIRMPRRILPRTQLIDNPEPEIVGNISDFQFPPSQRCILVAYSFSTSFTANEKFPSVFILKEEFLAFSRSSKISGLFFQSAIKRAIRLLSAITNVSENY